MAPRSRRISPLTLLAVIAALIAAPTGAHAASYPSGFAEQTLVTGLSMPTSVTWTPDGRTLIAEKSGRLRVAPAGSSTPVEVLDLSGTVNTYGDRGLLGVAVDSAFATNRFIYLLYTYELAPLTPDGSGPMVSRLSRFTLNNDNSVTNATTILGSYITGPCPAASNSVDCIPSDDTSHSIGTVLSAPDGTLYVGSGDAASFNVVDPLALRTYDERSLAGKILHVDRNGNGLPGHAMCASESNLTRVCTKIHAKGFRNPFRFALRPGGGLVVGDVGWNTQEEVDLIGSSGGNYGWPCYEAKLRTPGYKDRSECAAEYAKEGTANADRLPDHDYAHAGSGAAVLGGPEYAGDQYPTGYRGSVFFGDYAKGFLKRLVLNGSGAVTSVQDFAGGWSGTDLEIAPSGDLAYASFGTGAPGTGSIKRIVYAAGNRAPAAAATATPTSGSAPLVVAFDATGSSDPDGDPLTYAWSFGDGTTGTGATPSHTYTLSGVYSATVTVSDGRGQSDSRTVSISVGNAAPQPVISAPADGALYSGGANVQLQGSASDQQDGTLPASALTWDITLHHNDHVHPVTTITGDASPLFATRDDHDADSYYEITLTARDSGGLTGTKTITIRPRTVALSLTSSPTGAPVSYSGANQQAPFTTQSAVGYRTSISAGDSFVKGGRRWIFDRWSDGGARLHDITVPAADVTYTAVYRDGGVAGPVLALAFDEGTGMTTQDATGLGGTGSILGATWTAAGRYGNALSFDGAGDRVTVADSPSLDLTTAMTLEAWVKPRVNGPYDTVLLKEAPGDLAYGMYSTDGASLKPNGWVGAQGVYGPAGLPAGAWSHLALTSDGTTVRLYVNATLVSSAPATAPAPVTTGALRIGGNTVWANSDFDGQIDEVRVYDRALSAADLATDRDTAISIAGPPPPPPPGDTTPPSVAVTAPAADATLSATTNVTASATDDTGVTSVQFRLDGGDLGAADTTAPYAVAWDTTTAAAGAHTLTAVARDAAGNTRTSAAVNVTVDNAPPPPPPPPPPTGYGQVAALGFDEGTGTTAADASGRGNAGAITGATWTSTARFGKALDFDGVDDWVTVADSGSLDLSSALTVEAWVRPTATAGWQTVAIKENGNDLSYALYATSSGASRPNGWVGSQGIYGPAAVAAGAWTHLALVKDAATMRLYVNGTLAQTLATPVVAPFSSGPLRIGGSGMWGERLKGVIDEVRVYDRALSAADVVADRDTAIGAGSPPPPPPPPPPSGPAPVLALGFDDGAGTTAADSSGSARNGTLSGPAWSSDARFGKALSFDGVNDWVTVPDSAALDLTGPLTVEAWVKLRTSGAWQTVAIKEGTGNLAYGLYASSTGAPLPSGWLGDVGFYGPKSVPVGAWTHLALVYDGTVSRLYVNGVAVASRAGAVGIRSTSGVLRIGGSSMWGEWFAGTMDELRVYGRALTTNEIASDMGTAIRP